MRQLTELNLNNLMQTPDDAWNAGPQSPIWHTFKKRHTEDVAVYWPGQPEPARRRHNHEGSHEDTRWKDNSGSGKGFHVEFCTVASCNSKGEITEEGSSTTKSD